MAKIITKIRKHKTHLMNPVSLKNLEGHRFQKGVVTNPNGRPPKEFSITESLRAVSEMVVTDKVNISKMTFAQAAAYVHWQKALKGNQETYEFITSRLEGKPQDKVNIDVNVKHTPQELSDEQLAVIAATNILTNNTRNGSRGIIKAEASQA